MVKLPYPDLQDAILKYLQVHADSSNFGHGVSKREVYSQLLSEAKALNLANSSSLLWHAYKSLPPPSCHVNWAGFYVLKRSQPCNLILGPFHGRPACQSIAIGRGVCGAAAAQRRILRVEDVHQFPGHIACDGDSRSEIVVPILAKDGETLPTIKPAEPLTDRNMLFLAVVYGTLQGCVWDPITDDFKQITQEVRDRAANRLRENMGFSWNREPLLEAIR
ncbi:MAG: hypothetical protein ALECFALPRED_008051 [Alectoria fallacina]|uniref:GAF domain-containing protein n=1 Tax=Alectoria fallacina TaxID=1903189 RepID=A0A8H3J205_9LECA|nr:MAG: hypothetical protein ALECFALPRED_008051 [Alectoria fallacina]